MTTKTLTKIRKDEHWRQTSGEMVNVKNIPANVEILKTRTNGVVERKMNVEQQKNEQRMPTYRLFITDRENRKRKTQAGVLFEDGRGGFNLLLNPGISISYDNQDMYFYNLRQIHRDEHDEEYEDE